MSQHRSWVFKTPHLATTTNHRDDRTRLVDVCMATTAAPVYRSIAIVDHADGGVEGCRAFVDGGLWANNPVLVGLSMLWRWPRRPADRDLLPGHMSPTGR